MWLANAPVIFIWLWFALRARNLFFFSAANPAIETGGVLGESKINILKRLPQEVVPKTLFVEAGSSLSEVLRAMDAAGLNWPVIAKPNVGERGFLVKKLRSEAELKAYLTAGPPDFLLQAYIDAPVELAVMHHRMPDTGQGRVTSICVKENLTVTGDGQSSVRALMMQDLRSRLQLQRFEKEQPALLKLVPEKGQVLELEPIGNHCRGTKFLNGNHLIDDEIHNVFNRIASQMEGIHYGRFDLRCQSVEALRKGEFLVMEYNGVAAEPAHIYDPEMPVLEKYRSIYRHWEIIYRIYKAQRARGVRPMNVSEAFAAVRNYRAYMARYKSKQ
jgi:hypothetical protein